MLFAPESANIIQPRVPCACASLKELFDENGNAVSGSITAEITRRDFSSFELKITGFVTGEGGNANNPLAMGAYVVASKGSKTEYSYMQDDTKGNKEGNYYFVTYNQVIGITSEE